MTPPGLGYPEIMTLTGKEAREFVEQVRRDNAEAAAASLARAKAEAAASGKEPFDLAKLEELVDTSTEGRLAPIEERQERFERMYYVEQPRMRTIAELARLVDTLNRW
jgi:Tfp pilus assembly protein PilP